MEHRPHAGAPFVLPYSGPPHTNPACGLKTCIEPDDQSDSFSECQPDKPKFGETFACGTGGMILASRQSGREQTLWAGGTDPRGAAMANRTSRAQAIRSRRSVTSRCRHGRLAPGRQCQQPAPSQRSRPPAVRRQDCLPVRPRAAQRPSAGGPSRATVRRASDRGGTFPECPAPRCGTNRDSCPGGPPAACRSACSSRCCSSGRPRAFPVRAATAGPRCD